MYGWRMTGMNQSALEGFVKIVEHNSYSAAAEALYLSQSALSQQIRTLEGQLGVELFQHVPRRVLLTPAGQDFYPKAKQLVALYNDAVRHARAVQHRADPPSRHLEIAYHHDAMRMFGYDLLALTRELSLTYSPILHGCATRSELWRSLKKGETDLSFQLDSAEIYAQGLRFFPLCYVPEVCIFFYAEEEIPQGPLRLAQVLPYRWLPIREMLQEGARRGAGIIPPGTLRSAPYGGPSLKMVPLLYYRRPDLRFARLLDWNKGHRFGIVAGQKADDPVVQEYVQALQQAFPALTGPLFGVELEKIEV
jgi:DNA-binding transcriptional LysR family regulator